jgi:uncharacterized membrane protein YfcA
MNPDFWTFAVVGALAQLIDGALGMGFGVVCSTVLLSLGIPPANVSASVHAAKTFTGAASGLSHVIYRNVAWKLLLILSAGGAFGGVVGAYLLTQIAGDKVRPFVAAWLAIMGLVILYRAWKGTRPKVISGARPLPLGIVGGFFDAIGGGGWGPVVTSTLLGAGAEPRKTIGTVNAAEFFVAAAISGAFLWTLLFGGWAAEGLEEMGWSVGGLIAGGVFAAPLAGWTTKVLPLRALTWAVGVLVTVLAIYQGAEVFL